MMVSQKEIIEALRHVGCSSGLNVRHALANRIEAEGIAPPDGHIIVPTCAVRKKPYVPMTDDELAEIDIATGMADPKEPWAYERNIEAAVIKRAELEIKHD